jgi:hypothetical protein
MVADISKPIRLNEQCQKVVDGLFRLGGNLVVHFGS